MIDLDKAAALLRAEGLTFSLVHHSTGYAAAGHFVDVRVQRTCARVAVDARRTFDPEESDAMAAAITRAAALCRRIESECQKTEAP